MANDISRNAKRVLFNIEIRTAMNQGVYIMISSAIKRLAEELIVTVEFLLMNAGILIK
jgi:hypothetical protein